MSSGGTPDPQETAYGIGPFLQIRGHTGCSPVVKERFLLELGEYAMRLVSSLVHMKEVKIHLSPGPR